MISKSLPPAPTGPRTVRILYAEDVPELRNLARMVFARHGHSLDCGEDGREALEMLMANPGGYDLVITDHHMPRMNGMEFVQKLRECHFAGKIMVFSSELNPAVAAAYRKLNVDRILYKPVYPSVLRQALEELFPGSASTSAERLAGGPAR